MHFFFYFTINLLYLPSGARKFYEYITLFLFLIVHTSVGIVQIILSITSLLIFQHLHCCLSKLFLSHLYQICTKLVEDSCSNMNILPFFKMLTLNISFFFLAFAHSQSSPSSWNCLRALRGCNITARLSPTATVPFCGQAYNSERLSSLFSSLLADGTHSLPNQRIFCFLPSTCCDPAVEVTCYLQCSFCGCGQILTSEGRDV